MSSARAFAVSAHILRILPSIASRSDDARLVGRYRDVWMKIFAIDPETVCHKTLEVLAKQREVTTTISAICKNLSLLFGVCTSLQSSSELLDILLMVFENANQDYEFHVRFVQEASNRIFGTESTGTRNVGFTVPRPARPNTARDN